MPPASQHLFSTTTTAPCSTTHPPPAPSHTPHLFCMTMTAPCSTAHHRKVCTERTTLGESTGSDSISMQVATDQ